MSASTATIATTATTATGASRALIWFKRDLRVHDHAPLVAALAHTDALALIVIEPAWLQSPECDAQLKQALYFSTADIYSAFSVSLRQTKGI